MSRSGEQLQCSVISPLWPPFTSILAAKSAATVRCYDSFWGLTELRQETCDSSPDRDSYNSGPIHGAIQAQIQFVQCFVSQAS
ncbi:hypothetical protein HKD37_15G042768 [Glycine soja]